MAQSGAAIPRGPGVCLGGLRVKGLDGGVHLCLAGAGTVTA